jgi:uncharacterized protein with PIN domain
MVYVDTSVLVALCVREPKSAAVTRWYAACREELVCAVWCMTEFASALGIKLRQHGFHACWIPKIPFTTGSSVCSRTGCCRVETGI